MWIARDKSGEVYLYEVKPIKDTVFFCPSPGHHSMMYIGKEIYPELTYENSPQEVNLTLPTTGLDRGHKDSIVRGLKKLEEDYMLSYAKEIDWLNKLVN